MGNNIIHLSDYQHRKVYEYIVSLVVRHESNTIRYTDMYNVPYEIKPVPYSLFVEHLSECLVVTCKKAKKKYAFKMKAIVIEDFSICLKEKNLTFQLKDMLPSLQKIDKYQQLLNS